MKDFYDLIVIGSGPSGIASAIYAAKNGLSVLLIEKDGYIGGVSTTVMAGIWCGTASGGIFGEIMETLSNPVPLNGHTVYDCEELKEFYRKKVLQAGFDVMLYTFVTEVEVEGNSIRSITACTKDGKRRYSAKLYIDATGDGDISALAGVPFYIGRESDGQMQPATLFVMLGGVDVSREDAFLWKRNKELKELMKLELQKGNIKSPAGAINIMPGKMQGTALLNMTSCISVDGTKPEDLTRAEFECRSQIPPIVRFLRENAAGYENCYISKTGSSIGIRETRHLKGRYCLEREDLQSGRVFDDWVVTGAWYPFDIHNMTGHGQDPSEPKDKVKHYTIPYRCFLPETIDNLLFTGRCISGTHLASSSFRMMPICFAMGQATGTAASISVNKGLSPADIDIKLLQRTLLSQGVEAPDVSGC